MLLEGNERRRYSDGFSDGRRATIENIEEYIMTGLTPAQALIAEKRDFIEFETEKIRRAQSV